MNAPRKQYALFLDFDGTLVDIAPTPDAVFVSEDLRADLLSLRERLEGALALVSGRRIETLDAFMAPARFDAAGLHGLEMRLDGRLRAQGGGSRKLESVRAALEHRLVEWPGALIEDKKQSVAIHWRKAPEAEAVIRELLEEMAVTLAPDFRIQHGKAVAEILPARAHKGVAIDAMLNEPPYAGRVPVFIGDDVTDEDGFRIVNAHNGYTVKVGPEKTAATFRLASAHDVRARLGRWARDFPEDLLSDLGRDAPPA
jgi:trehalose 6-phosphate phosphatase